MRPLPLVVPAHGRSFEADTPPGAMPPDYPWEIIEQVTRDLYTELAGLVPGGRLIIAEESGRYIQLEQPDLVIEAIRQVVDAVRDPDTWAAQQHPTAGGDIRCSQRDRNPVVQKARGILTVKIGAPILGAFGKARASGPGACNTISSKGPAGLWRRSPQRRRSSPAR